MQYFCTLFDSNYINKGIALYLSIERYTDDFILYVMAMDRECQSKLDSIGFKHIKVECIEDIETGELLKAKRNRSRAEYCWTCGSVVTEHFFRTLKLPEITYLDSDLQFFSNPQIVNEELKRANASIGLSPHFINNTTFGTYCVQYVYFKRDENGKACLEWWKDKCLEWCYSKLENGKYGDQKYLDCFAEKFDNVYTIQNRGVGIANWNMEQYKYNKINHTLLYEGVTYPIVFFHYNGMNVLTEGGRLVFVISKYFPKIIKDLFIDSYAEILTSVYTKYIGVPVSGYVIRPQNKIKVALNRFWLLIRRTKIAMALEDWFMYKKYAQRKAPYSERKNGYEALNKFVEGINNSRGGVIPKR